ncbi:hypothetical protein [Humibacter sp.]|uniref:hypothetical protein n=1 Tax=Humibacter sp. TaxID=1940291 RepID=UPI002D1BFA5A|nr:hypothetical protein [Humibacter sp.]HVX07603.1 hypothetical protein [Humibacter sp.]
MSLPIAGSTWFDGRVPNPRSHRGPTFADLLKQRGDSHEASTSQTLPSIIRDRSWTDEDGTVWRMRGGDQPARKTVEHLLLDPEVRVLLIADLRPVDVALKDRAGLWAEVRQYYPEAKRREPGDHTDFAVAEFRDSQRRSLLVIERHC